MNFRVLMPMMALAIANDAYAQADLDELVPGRRHLSAYVAGSWAKAYGPALSSIPTRPYGMVVGRAEYVLERAGPIALSFFFEAIPAIVVGDVPRYHYADFWMPPAGPMIREKVWDEPALVYGAGVTPVGLQLYGRVSKRVSVFVSTSGGAAWFTRDMPVPDARQVNFLADLGAGLRITRGTGALIAGTKFQHMSNANLGRQNPGIDGNVIYAGFSRAR